MSQEVTISRVLQELAAIALFNPKSILDANGDALGLKDLPDEAAVAAQSLSVTYAESKDTDGVFDRLKTVEFKPWDKLKALNMLLAHLERKQAGEVPEDITPEEAASLLNLDAARKRA